MQTVTVGILWLLRLNLMDPKHGRPSPGEHNMVGSILKFPFRDADY